MRVAGVALVGLLAGCTGAAGGARTQLTQAQFEQVRDACHLQNARLGPSAHTDTTPLASGGTMNVTYQSDDPHGVSLYYHSNVMDPSASETMMCIGQQFEQLGAEALLSPEA